MTDSEIRAQNEALQQQVQQLQAQISQYEKDAENLRVELTTQKLRYQEVTESIYWRMTAPLRALGTWSKNLLKKNRLTYLAGRGAKFLMANGFKATWFHVVNKLRFSSSTARLAARKLYTDEELAAQRGFVFPRDIRFSILVPLYNTPENFLREMIQSVLDQTYANWELCLADGSDSAHPEVGTICAEYTDSRIRYKKLERNLGISGNTNACIDMSTGDYIALFDHDDLLHPAALYDMMQAICSQDADFLYTDENSFHNTPADAFSPHFKPDFAPDTLRANNYICHFTVFSRELMEKVGRFRSECDGSQDHDMILRLTEQAKHIVHIPKILYYWRVHAGSVAGSVDAKPYVIEAGHRAVSDQLKRLGLEGEVLDTNVPSMYRIRYAIQGQPLVSILIPNKDHIDDLKKCIDSVVNKSTWQNWEILVIENNSTDPATFAYYETLTDPRIRVIRWESFFNYSAINNFAAKQAKGDYILLLNNDIEVITPEWIEEMLMFAQRRDVGAVGAKLYYPDNTVQHAGIGIGILTLAGHLHRGFHRDHIGYMGRLSYAQDLSAVTAACAMFRRDVWEQVGGLDEAFTVAFNDVDLCMRIRREGYLIVFTPFAELYHYESKSRGDDDTPEKHARFENEVLRFQDRWKAELAAGDPYFNPNFDNMREDFSII